MLCAGRFASAAMNIQKAFSFASGSDASNAPKDRSSGSMSRMPPTHSATPIRMDSPITEVTVRLAPSSSFAPS